MDFYLLTKSALSQLQLHTQAGSFLSLYKQLKRERQKFKQFLQRATRNFLQKKLSGMGQSPGSAELGWKAALSEANQNRPQAFLPVLWTGRTMW